MSQYLHELFFEQIVDVIDSPLPYLYLPRKHHLLNYVCFIYGLEMFALVKDFSITLHLSTNKQTNKQIT